MSEAKSIYDRNKKQKISEKSGGQKTKNWSKPAPKEKTITIKFQGKDEPSLENNCLYFQYENSDCGWLCHQIPNYTRKNSTEILYHSVLWRERLHTATALQTELLYLFYWLCRFSVVDWKKTRLLPAHFLTMTFPFLFLNKFHFQTLLYIYQDRF